MLAKECGYLPGKFIHQIGSAHIYLNHIEQMKEQLSRDPLRSPSLHIINYYDKLSVLSRDADAEDAYSYEDFRLLNYKAHASIKGDVAV
jgi:thymidylate synthase